MYFNIILLCFSVIVPVGAWAQGSVEIYANGTRYESISAYNALKKFPMEEGHELDQISLEHGLAKAMADFDENGHSAMAAPLSSVELQERMRAVAAGRRGALLLISDPYKLRIAAYGDQHDLN